ncbi:exodeoxyribonuclease V subunit gamma [Flexivirga caeni]|uniref:RecBCD enzyme subunit RecC n=1 Tax=Flexivirga caeni TaxID=2294115 RepID=A0A3M9M2P1_9MICO|nr:exodeoxyribonuclease V subunit gamma [Flexivirga caeni]RNI19859.1 exodeoxyribonuclease V subunit gamma [Flexivirga caeni]
MTLILHRAERTDALADGLARLLLDPLPDPFVQELVIVPTRGVERWLAQSLSGRLGTGPRGSDGICAGVRFVAPHSLVAMLTTRDRDDPWHPDRLVWPLLETVDASLDETWCAVLAAHLGHRSADQLAEHRAGRRYAVARRLAGLFSSYAIQRPQLLIDWAAGQFTDGAGGDLDDDLHWQAKLWGALLPRVDAPPPHERHRDALEVLRAGGDPSPNAILPERLSLFGHTRMPVTEVELLAALAEHRDVHLWLPQPSGALWEELRSRGSGAVPRKDDDSADAVRHPLLATLGRDSRELQRSLPPHDDQTDPVAASTRSTTVLGHLQQDLHDNAAPDRARREDRVVPPDDRSVQVHACHGLARQVEVLREVVTGLLQDDPGLEPRDILVMCPDIESYAPLIQAAFGLAESAGHTPTAAHPAHMLRVKLADRSLATTNPLFEIASVLIDFAVGRVRVSELHAVLSTDPVRRRFELDEDDLARIADWTTAAEIRWGLDAEHRQRYQLGGYDQNTWQFGLRRLLLGVATTGDSGTVGSVLPVDDVASGDIGLVGRFAEFVDRLETAVDALATAHTVDAWMGALRQGVATLCLVPLENSWQQTQFDRELEQVRSLAAASTQLRVSDIRHLLRGHLEGRATRANFRTGTLTVCTMMPMRSVPHRVICLLGLDDGVFPRGAGTDGDDVLARRPMTGERDVRSEDRQLLLDAVLAATDHLIVTYSGAGEHTGQERPPAAPLGELIDAVRRTATWPDDRDVVVRHPLQPFDIRNLMPGVLDTSQAFSFDRLSLAGARAAQHQVTRDPRLLPEPLRTPATDEVSLADLLKFFEDPARWFVRQRLDVALPFEIDEVPDTMPIELDALQKWQIGDRALADSMRGISRDEIARMERLRGAIPPGTLGAGAVEWAVDGVGAVRAPISTLLGVDDTSIDLEVALPGGRRLTGTVSGLRGDIHLAVGYSTLKAKQRLQSWIVLLALTAGAPDRQWCTVTAGWLRGGARRQAGYYTAGPLDQEVALSGLAELVDVFVRGMDEPIPLPLQTSLAYAEALRRSPERTRAASYAGAQRWESRDFPGEADDAAQRLIHGGVIDFATLAGEQPRDDEAWNAATSRLGQYALRVWPPMLAAQRSGTT